MRRTVLGIVVTLGQNVEERSLPSCCFKAQCGDIIAFLMYVAFLFMGVNGQYQIFHGVIKDYLCYHPTEPPGNLGVAPTSSCL